MSSKKAIVIQPPLLPLDDRTLTVVISGLALGGAEWIVRDWIMRISKQWRVHLILLRNRDVEWSIPDGVVITRLGGKDICNRLKIIGRSLGASANSTCLAHLLSKDELEALEEGGAFPYQVFHNARSGWFDSPEQLDRTKPAIAVSHACKQDLINDGWTGDISVIHHLPRPRKFTTNTREKWRARWNLSTDAKVIGMIGSFKPQKDYCHALRILRSLHDQGEIYYLVIIGGIVGSRDREEWCRVREMVDALDLRRYVAMRSFIADAVQCAPAFDLVLNTSHYEGLSVATLEVLASGVPVVASRVGGQGEVDHPSLTLVEKDDSSYQWVKAIEQSNSSQAEMISSRFPSYRLWTLHNLVEPFKPSDRTVFVTANLNVGGAQRSLVNLAKELDHSRVSVAVMGKSYSDHFYKELHGSGVDVFRCSDDNDPFTGAESLVRYIVSQRVGTVVFWNTDAKLKLLLGKVLGHQAIRFVDVSPGGYAFESLDQLCEFGKRICYTTTDFYQRLDHLVLKYHGDKPEEFTGQVSVIPNGVPKAGVCKIAYASTQAPCIAVCGRLAPSKFLLEILSAMEIVRETYPQAELHIYGGYRESDKVYVDKVYEKADPLTHFHGLDFAAYEKYVEHDVFVVLGRHQGCPNAVLEALSVGMPVVANDDGGSREQVIDGKTGLLIKTTEPEDLAKGILSFLQDPKLAQKMGQAGRQHVLNQFSMKEMIEQYQELLWSHKAPQQQVV